MIFLTSYHRVHSLNELWKKTKFINYCFCRYLKKCFEVTGHEYSLRHRDYPSICLLLNHTSQRSNDWFRLYFGYQIIYITGKASRKDEQWRQMAKNREIANNQALNKKKYLLMWFSRSILSSTLHGRHLLTWQKRGRKTQSLTCFFFINGRSLSNCFELSNQKATFTFQKGRTKIWTETCGHIT